MEVTHKEFDQFAHFLQGACGIHLTPGKEYLVTQRLASILIENNIESLGSLVDQVKQPASDSLRRKVINAMTTNETFWFRDAYPFDYFKEILLPIITKEGSGNEIRLWSAACSTGQEPYSLSMVYEDFKQKNPSITSKPLNIVATDIANNIVETAKKGCYDKTVVARGLTHDYLSRYFTALNENSWEVKDHIRKRIQFRTLNLLESFSQLGKFDVIFCRNVLIYFNEEHKKDILTRLHASLKPNGYLCLGSSEGISNLNTLFEMIHCEPGIMYRARSIDSVD